MASLPANSALRVRVVSPVNGQYRRRRGGLEFGKEPRDLTAEDLPDGLAGAIAVAAICADPMLAAVMVGKDGKEQEIDAGVIAELNALIEAEGGVAALTPAALDPALAEAATSKTGDRKPKTEKAPTGGAAKP